MRAKRIKAKYSLLGLKEEHEIPLRDFEEKKHNYLRFERDSKYVIVCNSVEDESNKIFIGVGIEEEKHF